VGQSLSQLYVHLIFVTKQREPLLLGALRGQTQAYLAAVLNNHGSPARRLEAQATTFISCFSSPRTVLWLRQLRRSKLAPQDGLRRRVEGWAASIGRMAMEASR